MSMRQNASIAILGLGGTIAMVHGEGAGVKPGLDAAQLVAAVPELSGFTALTAESFRMVPGAHLTFDDLVALALRIDGLAASGVAGVVVTQGTDTIEETAFALDLLLDRRIAVVVTGAMRNPSLPGADGPANLLAAVRVAADERSAAAGVLVVLNDEIHAAQFVTKRHSTSPSAFQSPGTGPIGYVTEGAVRFLAMPMDRLTLPGQAAQGQSRVALLRLPLDDDGRLIDAVLDLGFSGLVVEGLGGGHANERSTDALKRVAMRIPVVLCSRAGAGDALRSTYGFTGGEIDLLQGGLIPGGRLDGLKSRVLLHFLLLRCASPEAISQVFGSVR